METKEASASRLVFNSISARHPRQTQSRCVPRGLALQVAAERNWSEWFNILSTFVHARAREVTFAAARNDIIMFVTI